MNVDDVIETLKSFLVGLQTRDASMAAEVRHLELVFDEEGLFSITSDVGAGWAALRYAP
jgi:hypothetical protein